MPRCFVSATPMSPLQPKMLFRVISGCIYPRFQQVEDALNPSKERLKVDKGVENIMHVLLCKITLNPSPNNWSSNIQREQISIFLINNNTGRYVWLTLLLVF